MKYEEEGPTGLFCCHDCARLGRGGKAKQGLKRIAAAPGRQRRPPTRPAAPQGLDAECIRTPDGTLRLRVYVPQTGFTPSSPSSQPANRIEPPTRSVRRCHHRELKRVRLDRVKAAKARWPTLLAETLKAQLAPASSQALAGMPSPPSGRAVAASSASSVVPGASGRPQRCISPRTSPRDAAE